MSTQPAAAKRCGTGFGPRLTNGEAEAAKSWRSSRALAVMALFLAPSAVTASVALQTTLTPLPAPFSNGTTRGMPSSITVTIRNNGTQVAHSIAFQLPTTGYTSPAGTAPDATWTVATTAASGGTPGVVRFTAACSSAGIAPGDSADFVLGFVNPAPDVDGDAETSAFQVTGSTMGALSTQCDAANPASGTSTFTAPSRRCTSRGT